MNMQRNDMPDGIKNVIKSIYGIAIIGIVARKRIMVVALSYQ